MAKKRVYLTPIEVEEEMQKARKEIGFIGDVESASVRTMIETAKQNGKFGDKLLLVISPKYIHIPEWQRKVSIPRALSIGNSYNKYKWEVPKILYLDGKLMCIDGMHRIYGAFKGDVENVTVEIMADITEQKAIELFLDQTTDRRIMSPIDTYSAALKAEKEEYVLMTEICDKHHVRIKGNKSSLKNPVGVLTSISDGVRMCKSNAELFDKILRLIGKLQWNGACINEGKAYSAKILRVMKKLYAYYADREEQMENVLLNNCKGSQYFNDNLEEKYQDTLFDYLAEIVDTYIDIPVVAKKKASQKTVKVKMA